ncbi:hypothetical protein H0N95_00975 [Candidatus Micrarchaeota archaeon]|nr:hypothetical protein [Candidatus Micrarchaeota archaeon]
MADDEKPKAGTVEIERRPGLGSKELLAKSEVSLWLDTYDDVFSDFDPRPYDHRALSDDFLQEAKRATRELEPGVLELRFLMPAHERDYSEENVVRHRLHEHFRKHATRLEKEMKWIVVKAAIFVIFGFLMLLMAAFLKESMAKTFIFYFMIVVLEPSGWFMVWYGMDQIFYSSKEINPDLTFYERMAKAEITFDSY